MPMFYINWGRYTQLIGQIILPATALILDGIYLNWMTRVGSWSSFHLYPLRA